MAEYKKKVAELQTEIQEIYISEVAKQKTPKAKAVMQLFELSQKTIKSSKTFDAFVLANILIVKVIFASEICLDIHPQSFHPKLAKLTAEIQTQFTN